MSDFGLAREIYASSYYKMNDDHPMPIAWMAIETLNVSSRKFTTKSDVVSC